MIGLVVDGSGFELVVDDERAGRRRLLAAADVELLKDVAARYVRAVHAGSGDGVFVGLGRELYAWLDGDGHLRRHDHPDAEQVRTKLATLDAPVDQR